MSVKFVNYKNNSENVTQKINIGLKKNYKLYLRQKRNFKYFFNMVDNCPDCKRPNTSYNWCQNCNSQRFQQDFDKWTSGNKYIDKFIQDVQLNARTNLGVIEWIPYSKLRNIEYLTKDGFSTIYKAIWLDEDICSWNNTWDGYGGTYVVLKSLNNSSNINDDFLNEVSCFKRICKVFTLIYTILICFLVEKSFIITVFKSLCCTRIWNNSRSKNIKLYFSNGIRQWRKSEI
jgi:hypothetical protein